MAIESLYYLIGTVSLLSVLYFAGVTKMNVLLVLIFAAGIFQYLGSAVFNLYQVGIVLLTGYYALPSILHFFKLKKFIAIKLVALAFIACYFISYLLYGGGILTVLSQLVYKYLFFLLLFMLFYTKFKREAIYDRFVNVTVLLIFTQIFMAFVKMAFFGTSRESIVGTIGHSGGGMAVAFPLIAMGFYWFVHRNKMNVFHWAIIVLILSIAIASGKRTPVFLFPIILYMILWANYGGRLVLLRTLPAIPIIFLIFYLAVRMTPSLTPETRTAAFHFGTFDISYVYSYLLFYNFDVTNLKEVFNPDYITSGRGGSLIIVTKPERLGLDSVEKKLFGHGLFRVAIAEGGRFVGEADYGVTHQGNLSHFAREIYALGYLTMLLFFILILLLINTSKNRKIATIILLIFLFELFLYANQIIVENPCAVLAIGSLFLDRETKQLEEY